MLAFQRLLFVLVLIALTSADGDSEHMRVVTTSNSPAKVGQEGFNSAAKDFCAKADTADPTRHPTETIKKSVEDTAAEAAKKAAQQWFSFNASQQVKNPQHDTTRIGPDHRPHEGCTKWDTNDRHLVGVGWYHKKEDTRINSSCTQCKPDRAFMLGLTKSGEGECLNYILIPRQQCVNLDEQYDHYDGQFNLYNHGLSRLCTKIAKFHTGLRIRDPAKRHGWKWKPPYTKSQYDWFKKAAGFHDQARGFCDARKETICTPPGKGGMSCHVKKTIFCKKVCKCLKVWSSSDGGKPVLGCKIEPETCYADLCEDDPKKGKHGSMVCSDVAMTF